MIKYIQIFLLMIILSYNGYCQLEDHYISKEITLISQFKMLVFDDHYVGGNTLDIQEDSTYNLTTCSIIENGRWHIEAESLILHAYTAVYRIDSLELANPFYSITKKPRITKYYIGDNELSREFWGGTLENKYIVKDILIKEE